MSISKKSEERVEYRVAISVVSSVILDVKIRVEGVARTRERRSPKSLDSDKNFKPEHTLFCRELRFVAIYALFGDFWAK